ncbi:coenzyme A disulfide reductase [Cecembia lonarensis LW9]|uniref:Coenzyme A disulfide reductase n=1 Tax=Cecembia lonarensis (strain CCUG 58316 / KCTC 22772 / LW9) TaxID=1225176 RepID=K1M0W1_CECL9|nr:coenzyme A disulfide reductase [Cecembia lonarensis LW9]
MCKKIVVIGGDAAGMSAASKIRRTHKNWEITVFEKSPHTSYSACGMPYLIAGQVDKPEKLIARSPDTF